MNSLKGALKSKTIWWNIIVGGLEIANTLLVTVLPPGTLMALNVLGNVALRAITSESLEAKGSRK